MNTAISTLEIPQGATELTLDELKLICGGEGDGCEEAATHRRKLRLEKVIVIKVFKRKPRRSAEDGCDGSED